MTEIISFLFALACIVISAYFMKDGTDLQGTIRDIGWGAVASTLLGLVLRAWNSKRYIRIWLQCYLRPGEPVRVSMAYLFRIEVDGHFLLVRNHKNPARGYQPVGGVYRYLKAENDALFKTIGLYVDTKIPVDEDSRNDLRCSIPERKNLPTFIDWFNTKKDREIDPWREFYEELIAEGLLSQQDFPYIQYNYCKSDYEGIKGPDAFNIDEFLYADIVELKPENSRQIDALRHLFDVRSQRDEYMFATPEDIRSGKTATGRVILPHAQKLLC